MKPEIKLTGDEHDCFYRRRILCYLERQGMTKWIKRNYRHRVRQLHKRQDLTIEKGEQHGDL